MKKILVIEDEEGIRDNILDLLEIEGFDVIVAENGQVGAQMAREQLPDLIICDVLMPQLDGHGVLESLNREPVTDLIPFIFLTAKADRVDLRQGMELGADDYLTKPFSTQELLKAVRTQLAKQDVLTKQFTAKLKQAEENFQNLVGLDNVKELQNLALSLSQVSQKLQSAMGSSQDLKEPETSPAKNLASKPKELEEPTVSETEEPSWLKTKLSSNSVFNCDDLTINYAQRKVFRGGKEVKLTQFQFDLLKYLAQNAGRVITHRQALMKVWGYEYEQETQYLHVFVNQLRKKIEADPTSPNYILTERGVGYRFKSSR